MAIRHPINRCAVALLCILMQAGVWAAFAATQQPTIGIMEFEVSGGVGEDIADFCAETLTEALVRARAFRVIERTRVQRTLARLKELQPDLDEDRALAKLMNELQLDQLCRGAIRKIGGKTYIRARRSGRDGAVLAVAKRSFADENEIEAVVTELARELAGKTPAPVAPVGPSTTSPAPASTMRVALTKPDVSSGVNAAYATFLYDRLTSELVKLGRCRVIDWQEVERSVQAAVVGNPRLSPEQAKIQALRSLDVSRVFTPSLTHFGGKYYISVRVLDRNLTVQRTVEATAKKESEIDKAAKDVALRLALTPKEWAARQKGLSDAARHAAARRQEAARQFTNSIGMRFRLISPGSFIMGSKDGESDEGPIRKVSITKPFYMGMHEVTQEQYERVMRDNPSKFKDPSRPVERVTWADAQEFCLRLSVIDGKTYRLPTEAEWEFACRAGTYFRYSWGEDFDPRYAWYEENSNDTTQPVGTLKPNPWGLFDMSGNVWEWCEDWYTDSYADALEKDPTGPKSGQYRVLRGGSWFNAPEQLRSANRRSTLPSFKHVVIGFRVVCEKK